METDESVAKTLRKLQNMTTTPKPCKTCGSCPTCGKVAAPQWAYPYYAPHYHTAPYWTVSC